MAGAGLQASPTTEVLLEESILGWKEYELEVMRDRADNVVIICSIENLDPMGVHTGDSITVAPQMTLSDRQYQEMRDEAMAVIRKVGVLAREIQQLRASARMLFEANPDKTNAFGAVNALAGGMVGCPSGPMEVEPAVSGAGSRSATGNLLRRARSLTSLSATLLP